MPCCIVHIHGRNLTTLADCAVFIGTPCRMLDYLCSSYTNTLWAGDMTSPSHQDLLFQWLDNYATKELELHLLGIELFWNILLHFGKSPWSASGTFSIGNLRSFALEMSCFFIHTQLIDPVCPPGLGPGGYLHYRITLLKNGCSCKNSCLIYLQLCSHL